MPQWIRMAKLTGEGIKKVRGGQLTLLGEVRQTIEKEGGKLVGAWATVGRYDIISLVEAPDEQTMLNIDAAVAGMRIYHSETLPASPSHLPECAQKPPPPLQKQRLPQSGSARLARPTPQAPSPQSGTRRP